MVYKFPLCDVIVALVTGVAVVSTREKGIMVRMTEVCLLYGEKFVKGCWGGVKVAGARSKVAVMRKEFGWRKRHTYNK